MNNTFTDAAAGLSISPVWADAVTAGVNVTVGSGGLRAQNNPAVSVFPALQQGAAAAMLTYTVSVTNKDVACPAATFAASASFPAGWTVTFTPPTLGLAPGATGAMAMKVTSAAAATGSTLVPATASNTADATLKGSAGATYQVQAPGSGAGTFSDNFNRADAAALGNGWTRSSGTL